MSVFWDKLEKLAISRSGDRAPRYSVDVGVRISEKNSSTFLECNSVNISRTGILVEYKGTQWPDWEEGQIVVIIIQPSPPHFDKELKGEAIIARTFQKESLGPTITMQIGLRFL